jgi:hypothetical protein
MVLGDGIRRNITTVSKEEQTRLKNAFVALHTSFHYPGPFRRNDFPNKPVGGVSYWFKQDEIHANTHVHECPAFLPWHRELINRLEALLREFDPQLSLHYWDWTTSPKPLFTSDFMGSASGDAGEPWLSSGFYVPGATNFRSDSSFDSAHNNPFDPPLSINRDVSDGAPVTPEKDAAVINATDFPSMRVLLERSHGNAHGFIGGTLSDPHTSFRDPFVFLLHSNVDRLFAMWQLQSSHQERLNPHLVYGGETNSKGSGDVANAEVEDINWGILSPLEPWAGPGLDTQTSETGIIANVRTTRPWASPENMQKFKDSRAVVIPARYDTTPGAT